MSIATVAPSKPVETLPQVLKSQQSTASITGSLVSQRWELVITGFITPKAFQDLKRAVKLAYRKNNILARKSLAKPISGVTTNGTK